MFLFFTGLVISLFTIHHTIAWIVFAASIAYGLVYVAITVMPAIYHNSPYHSPISALCWYISRKLAKLSLCGAHHIVRFLRKYTSRTCADTISSLATWISEHNEHVLMSIASAREHAAQRQDWEIDARALSWTLDKSDEEGPSQLEHVVAGIPKFLRSKAVKEPIKVVEHAMRGSSVRQSLYRDITVLLIKSLEPGLLPNYRDLSGSELNRRIWICLEALYFLPHAIENILRHVSENFTDPKVRRGFASVFRSGIAFYMAQGIIESKKLNQRPEYQRVVIAARCMATVIASRLSIRNFDPGPCSTIPFDFLGIQDSGCTWWGDDNFRLRILNHFLSETVLEFIHVDTDILFSTLRLVIYEPKDD